MDYRQYLKRLDVPLELSAFSSLMRLQDAHLKKIPFENLDVIQKEPIYLNLKTMYAKVIGQGRGGYCYELNGLFQALLTELGYPARLISATVLRPNNEWAKADTHAAMIVELDQSYLVDVGFGAMTPRIPVPLSGEAVHTNVGEIYKVEKQTDHIFDLIRETKNASRVLYRFSSKSKQLIDFHEGCVFNQVSKDSTFTHTDILSLATEKGRVTLHDHLLTEVKGEEMTKSTLSTEEKEHVLTNIFGISLK